MYLYVIYYLIIVNLNKPLNTNIKYNYSNML